MKTVLDRIETRTKQAAVLRGQLSESLRIQEVCPAAFEHGPVTIRRLTLSRANGTREGIVYTTGAILTKGNGETVDLSAADYDYIKTGGGIA